MADVNIPWFAAPTNIASGVADADKAAYQAQAAGTEARGKAYDLKLKQTVEALMAHETLGEEEILNVTGLPRAPALENRPLPPEAARQLEKAG